MLLPGHSAKLFTDQEPTEGSCARLRVYLEGIKKAVIDRDTDLLTPEEHKDNVQEVKAAILEELKVWTAHKCFERRPRAGSRNILDVRWVGKWKYQKSASNPNQKVRMIRMRMTLRGFKDLDAEHLDTYAGTSSRSSQRLVTSEAVIRGWALATIDVRKAFLKGTVTRSLCSLPPPQ